MTATERSPWRGRFASAAFACLGTVLKVAADVVTGARLETAGVKCDIIRTKGARRDVNDSRESKVADVFLDGNI